MYEISHYSTSLLGLGIDNLVGWPILLGSGGMSLGFYFAYPYDNDVKHLLGMYL